MNDQAHPEGSTNEAVCPFPVDVLPPPLATFVHEAAAALPCPMDFVGVPMLAFLGAAIGTRRVIEVKPGWYEAPVLWTAVVADLGSKKSPALGYATLPLKSLQSQFLTAYNSSSPPIQSARSHLSS
jgi:Protein of unknown function (DUF3987)